MYVDGHHGAHKYHWSDLRPRVHSSTSVCVCGSALSRLCPAGARACDRNEGEMREVLHLMVWPRAFVVRPVLPLSRFGSMPLLRSVCAEQQPLHTWPQQPFVYSYAVLVLYFMHSAPPTRAEPCGPTMRASSFACSRFGSNKYTPGSPSTGLNNRLSCANFATFARSSSLKSSRSAASASTSHMAQERSALSRNLADSGCCPPARGRRGVIHMTYA